MTYLSVIASGRRERSNLSRVKKVASSSLKNAPPRNDTRYYKFLLVGIFPLIFGCASMPIQKNSHLKELSQDIQKDKQAQSAIESVTEAMSSNRIAVHYCPVDGERFSPRVQVCPTHHVLLKEVEEH